MFTTRETTPETSFSSRCPTGGKPASPKANCHIAYKFPSLLHFAFTGEDSLLLGAIQFGDRAAGLMLYESRFTPAAGFGRIELSPEIRYREGPKPMMLGHHGSCIKAITPLGRMRDNAIAYGGGMVWIGLTWLAQITWVC